MSKTWFYLYLLFIVLLLILLLLLFYNSETYIFGARVLCLTWPVLLCRGSAAAGLRGPPLHLSNRLRRNILLMKTVTVNCAFTDVCVKNVCKVCRE